MADASDLLKGVPHRNNAAKLEELSDGVLVTIPLAKRWWLRPPITWIFAVSPNRRVQLDAMGAWVLERCDGRCRIEELIEQVMERYKLSFQEARGAVLQFMKMLTERGIIAVVPPKSKARK
jgi:hypothetical protein